MKTSNIAYVRVAIATPLRKCFDYQLTSTAKQLAVKPGMRVKVAFGRQKNCIAVVLELLEKTEVPAEKIKTIIEIIDSQPVLTKKELALLKWASRYYQYPEGEVVLNSLPLAIRQGKAAEYPTIEHYQARPDPLSEQRLKRAKKQQSLYEKILQSKVSISLETLRQYEEYSPTALKGLLDKELVIKKKLANIPVQDDNIRLSQLPVTTQEQQTAIDAISAQLNQFACFLLNGVTGSGKTRVYIQLIADVIAQDKQALVLLPEIGLTPQFVARFEQAFNTQVGLYHSGMTDHERLQTWLMARDKKLSIILGTRSAVWLGLESPGIIIIDEEHDLSYKQQDGFRYSARDVAIRRAQQEDIPIVLGSATPSLESVRNAESGRYQELLMSSRVQQLALPKIHLLDLKHQVMHGILSHTLIDMIAATIEKKLQAMLFINRRGFSPAILCHHCGHVAHCNRCDKTMTYHKQRKIIWCHHCDRQLPVSSACPDCEQSEWLEVGHGTERLEEDIKQRFPNASVVRIDRDSIRNKGQLKQLLDSIQSGEADILIGTQMLAKGHDFPKLGLVGMLDIDGGLYSTDFRASERMAQLITQVSGRAGRSGQQGQVLIQTHHPEHPLLDLLINQGYVAFAKQLLSERAAACLPPFSHIALLRAEAHQKNDVIQFLERANHLFQKLKSGIEIFGPFDSLMPRRAGRFRMQLMIQADKRPLLARALSDWIRELEQLSLARKVRWSIDVDPQDMM